MQGKIKIIFLILIILFLVLLFPLNLEAKRGCCSWHGGVAYCDTSVGRYVCNDGTYSPSCGCAYIPPTSDDLIKKEVEKSKLDYYRNPHWFREKLITKIINSLHADIGKVAFYVYTMLPDIK